MKKERHISHHINDNKAFLFPLVCLLFSLCNPAVFGGDLSASVKALIQSENVDIQANIFFDIDNSPLTCKEFLAKLENGSFGYAMHRDSSNIIVDLRLVPMNISTSIPKPVVGGLAPSFRITAVDGTLISSTVLHGKVVVIKFGSTHCAPCEQDWEQIRFIPAIYEDKPVVFLSFQISGDTSYVPEYCNYIPVLHQWETALNFGITSYPTHMVIDSKGVIRCLRKGASSFTKSELQKTIDSALVEMKTGE